MSGALAPWRSVAALFLLAAVISCATARPPDAALATRFAQADARRARELAPDLYARAERALADARSARDDSARSDHSTRAELLLSAAIAEAERIELERSAARADGRGERALSERAAVERERIALEQRAEREASARSARAQAERLLGPDAAGADRAPAASERAVDARFLRDRARITLAAAVGLGLPPEEGRKVEQRIAKAEQSALGKAAIGAGEEALSAAERALGAVRARSDQAPSPEQRAALVEMAHERGFLPVVLERGVAIPLDGLFAVGSAQPAARGRLRLRQLAALATAHPQGPIAIEVRADGAEPSALRLREARAQSIAADLRRAIDPARLVTRGTAPAPPDPTASQTQVVFTSFGSAAPNTGP